MHRLSGLSDAPRYAVQKCGSGCDRDLHGIARENPRRVERSTADLARRVPFGQEGGRFLRIFGLRYRRHGSQTAGDQAECIAGSPPGGGLWRGRPAATGRRRFPPGAVGGSVTGIRARVAVGLETAERTVATDDNPDRMNACR